MKTTREKKNWKTVYSVCAGVLALICAANVAVLSSCSYVRASDETYGAQTAGEDSYLCDPVEVAFTNYFCVPDFADITEEQFAGIASVDVFLVKPQDGTPNSVYVSIDGGSVEMLSPCILTLDAFENRILPKIDALEEADGEVNFDGKKFRAFYCVKDPNDPELEPRAVAEMQSLFPITKETAVALYDPYTTEREDALIYAYLYNAGLVNEAAFSELALEARLSAISALDGADITVTAAESIAGFADDADVFEDRSPMYAAYMSEYMSLRKKEADDSAALVLEELSTQIDINGNGIVGE